MEDLVIEGVHETLLAVAAISCIVLFLPAVNLRSAYRLRGLEYFFKYITAHAVLTLCQWMSIWTMKEPTRLWRVSASFAEEQMDGPQCLNNGDTVMDSCHFCAFDSHGNWLITRIVRRTSREAELWLTMKLTDEGIYESPIHPATYVINTPEGGFSAGGLTFQMLEGCRRWRISFNGLLRSGIRKKVLSSDDGNQEKLALVKFTFIWEATSDLYNPIAGISGSCLASALAEEPWSAAYFMRLRSAAPLPNHYAQAGGMLGSISIDCGEPRRIALRGVRERAYGPGNSTLNIERHVCLYFILEDGSTVVLAGAMVPGSFKSIVSGCVFKPNAEMYAITKTNLRVDDVSSSSGLLKKHYIKFEAGGREYEARLMTRCCPTYYHGRQWDSVRHENVMDVMCNNSIGRGVADVAFYRIKGSCPLQLDVSVPLLRHTPGVRSLYFAQQLVIPLESDMCSDPAIVGGKASQLALLIRIQKCCGFEVPSGICLTTEAFKTHISADGSLSHLLAQLEREASDNEQRDLNQACEALARRIRSMPLKTDLRQAVVENLRCTFSEDARQKLFAVRSSAVGEDGAEMSSAGQLVTLLAVRGDVDDILSAVLSCWASQFSLQSVVYRRQRGQAMDSGLGVIIQEMVLPECAGVLFTRDPLTGNPSSMTIEANYGLGESVVSGSCDVDSVTVRRYPGHDFAISEKNIGKKTTVITAQGGGGTERVDSGSQAETCCLADDAIYKLCYIGALLEQHFGNALDIEWALGKGKVYLLQARPMTTIDQEDDYEIIHEFDTPHSRDTEFCTAANLSEILPGAVTPLTISSVFRVIETSMQDFFSIQGYQTTKHSSAILKCASGHAFLNLHALEMSSSHRVLMSDRKMAELYVMGQTIDSMTDHEVDSYNPPLNFRDRLLAFVKTIYALASAEGHLKRVAAQLLSYEVTASTEAAGIYADIDTRHCRLREVFSRAFIGSSSSVFWAQLMMATLNGGALRYTQDHYSDFALLLSSCNSVLSATVPVMLKEIANQIKADGYGPSFCASPPKEATKWLLSGASGTSGILLSEFLDVHGHRCVRELDMWEKSWSQDPTSIVVSLQILVAGLRPGDQPTGSDGTLKRNDVSELMARLKTPLTAAGRAVIKYILPKARAAVGRREKSKSLQVKINDKFKQAYWKLAAAMRKEGRLPDEDLLFFLTHSEIGALISTRSPRLVMKAQRRHKLYFHMNSLTFQRDYIGHPFPVSIQRTECTESHDLTGVPVSLGTVRGKARVLSGLHGAGSIKRGEILIVSYTDVGWSPYFPLISGLVAEVGSLVSHGAVVAREYGLPCVVNCKGATTKFFTGDTVELCGETGVLRKIQAPDCCAPGEQRH